MFGDPHPYTGEEMKAPRFGAVIETLRPENDQFVVVEIGENAVQACRVENDELGVPGTIPDHEIGKTVGRWTLNQIFRVYTSKYCPDTESKRRILDVLQQEHDKDLKRP